jgi:hypothetical protein
MFKQISSIIILVLIIGVSTFAQGTIDKYGNYHPTEDQTAKNKRVGELLQHPTFISLRLTSQRRDIPREEPTTTPSPYTVDQRIHFELFLTQNSTEDIILSSSGWPYSEYRPELVRDGDLLPYTKHAQEEVEKSEKEQLSGSTGLSTTSPAREYLWNYVQLEDWYESPLRPGHYQLIVRKRFARNGDWAESNPVTFDVVPRRPAAPIPEGLKVRLVPSDSKSQREGQPYRLGSEGDVDVLLENDSDKPVRVSVIDPYYGNRLQLFKDGKLIPYREETAKLIESKDATPRLADVVSDFFIDPKITRTEGLRLKDWYGPLGPGLYRLIDRRRFEIDGPWTADSAELLFEVVPQPPMR